MISQVSVDFIDKFLNSSTVAVIVGALLAGWFGFRKYRSQKVWENIEDRYFKKGIESLILYLNYLRTTVEHNYSNSVRVLKKFKELDHKEFLDWFDKRDVKQDQFIPAKIPNSYMISIEILNNVNWGVLCGHIFSEMSFINDYYITEMMLCLRSFDEESKGLNKKEFAEILDQILEKKIDEVKELRLYDVIEVLEGVLFRLREMNINSYKKLKNINKDLQIQNLLKKLEKVA